MCGRASHFVKLTRSQAPDKAETSRKTHKLRMILVTVLTECEALPVPSVPPSRAAPISNTVGGSGKHDFKGGALKWRLCVSGYEEWTKGPEGGRGGKARDRPPSGRGLLRRRKEYFLEILLL